MKHRWASITAVILGCLALTLTLLALYGGLPASPPPSPQVRVRVELYINGVQLGWKPPSRPVEQQPPPSPALLTQQRVQRAGYAAGGMAILCAVLAWVRREGVWLGFLGVTLAAAAMAWYVFVIVLFVFVWSGAIFVFPIERWTGPTRGLQPTGDTGKVHDGDRPS